MRVRDHLPISASFCPDVRSRRFRYCSRASLSLDKFLTLFRDAASARNSLSGAPRQNILARLPYRPRDRTRCSRPAPPQRSLDKPNKTARSRVRVFLRFFRAWLPCSTGISPPCKKYFTQCFSLPLRGAKDGVHTMVTPSSFLPCKTACRKSSAYAAGMAQLIFS